MDKLGLTPSSLVLDEKEISTDMCQKIFLTVMQAGVTLRQAVERSLNLPAVRVLSKVGIQSGKMYASSVGIPLTKRITG